MPLCKVCKRPIRMMCQTGTGYCSLNCQDSLWARNHEALIAEFNKGLVVRHAG